MLYRFIVGQRTPGYSTRQAAEFEHRINQRYVDYVALMDWGYLGVFEVEGLVPGMIGEIYPIDAADPEEAFEKDSVLDAAGIPADVAAFYVECRALFWQRGNFEFWFRTDVSSSLLTPIDEVEVTLLGGVDDGAAPVLFSKGFGEQPAGVKITVIGTASPTLSDEPLPPDLPSFEGRLQLPLPLRLRPLAPAPPPSHAAHEADAKDG